VVHENRAKKADGIGQGVLSKKFGSFNSENFQPLIQVNFVRPPDDLDDRFMGSYEYHYGSGGRSENTFSGIYQVVKVDSKFNQGQFTQTLHCVRLNQQQQGNAAQVIEQQISKNYKEVNNEATITYPGSSNPRKFGGNIIKQLESEAKTKVSNAVKKGVEVTLADGRKILKQKRGQ